MIKDKRGISTFGMFGFAFLTFFAILFLGILLFVFSQINSVLDQDLDIGQVNLQDVNAVTFGAINTSFINNADTIGLMILLSMSLLMIMNAYITGGRYPKLFLVVDIFILVFVFIVAVYVSQTYNTFINSVDLLETIFIDQLPKSSTFVLKLPYLVGTLGALIIIFSYSGLNRQNGEINVSGY